MWIFYQIKAVSIALFLLFVVLLPACIVALPFGIHTRLRIVSPIWAFCSSILLRYACQVHIDVKEDHRSPEISGVIPFGLYVANHQSFIDIPLITTLFQAPPIMKKEVLYIPIFGWLGWVSGALPISRGRHHSRKEVFEKAKHRILVDRIGVQVYPEGTRSKTALPKEFKDIKRTLFMFAYNEQIPVIPTSIYGTRGVLSPKGIVRPGRHVGVIVHKEIDPKNFSNSEEFCRTCWEKVLLGHNEMQAKLSLLNEN